MNARLDGSATIELAPVGGAASAARLVRKLEVDRLRAAGLPAVRPGSTSRPALPDQARPLAISAWLSGAGARWIERRIDDPDLLSIFGILRRTGGSGPLFWRYVLTTSDRVSRALVDAKNAEERIRWGTRR